MGRREHRERREAQPEAVEFTVYARTDSAAVGTAGLFQINHAHGTAKFGIAIGERRGQGSAPRPRGSCSISRSTCSQLRNVLLEAMDWNVAGLTAYERAGFRRMGVRRGAAISRGRPTDVVIMDAIPEDFGASVLV